MGKFTGYLIAVDYDGTFNRPDRGGAGRNPEYAEYFRREGGVFALITGRPYADFCGGPMKEIAAELADCVASSDGATVFYPDGRIVVDNLREVKYALAIWEKVIKTEGATFMGAACDDEYTLFPLTEEGRGEVEEFFSRHKYFRHVNAGFPSPRIAEAFIDEINAAWPGVLNPQKNGGAGNAIDVPPFGVTKATGVMEVAKIFNIPRDNIYTSGDSFNDLPMIKEFHGYPVDNAADALKDAAEGVVPDVASIVEIIEKTRK